MTRVNDEPVIQRTMVTISEVDGARLATIVGEIDISNSKQIGTQLAAAAREDRHLAVSLEQCTYSDSSGLAMLIKLERELGDGLVLIVPPGSPFQRIFTITGLDRVLQIFASKEEALAASS